jgi:hypothetical protein
MTCQDMPCFREHLLVRQKGKIWLNGLTQTGELIKYSTALTKGNVYYMSY